jgi:hypothetical protein
MEQDQALETFVSPEPHFDEEWTLLSARPVVPLERLKARAERRKALALASAFVAAILLGASVALIAVFLRQPSSDTAITTVSGDGEHQPRDSKVTQTSESAAAASEATAVVDNSQSDSTKVILPKLKSRSSSTATILVPPLGESLQAKRSAVDESDEPRAQLSEQWQERRLRRVEKHDRRGRGDHHSRDLMRIEEIFEGPRSPE